MSLGGGVGDPLDIEANPVRVGVSIDTDHSPGDSCFERYGFGYEHRTVLASPPTVELELVQSRLFVSDIGRSARWAGADLHCYFSASS
jgi:hypothetical protein